MTPKTFNPDYLNSEATLPPAKKRVADLAYSLAIIILALLLLVIGYLLYLKYFKPGYQLTAWLPENYNLAISLNRQPGPFFNKSSQDILDNPLIKNSYQKIISDLNKAVSVLPGSSQDILKKTKQAIVFFPDEKNFGAIVELANNNDAKQLVQADFGNWSIQLEQKRIVLIAGNRDLLKLMAKKVGPKDSLFSDLTLEIKPFLTVYLGKSFFSQHYLNPWLAELQTILQPLALEKNKNFTIKFSSLAKQLIIDLSAKGGPASGGKHSNEEFTTTTAVNLKPYLKLLPTENDLTFGLSDLSNLASQLDASQPLRDYFKTTDSRLWQNWQLSLSQLLKNLTAPLLISSQGANWQLISPSANQSLLDWILRQYLAQFAPIKKTMVLPDGTKAVELIADPKTIKWELRQANNWQIFELNHPQKPNKIGYAVNGFLMIVSNNLGNLPYFKEKSDKNEPVSVCNLANISTILSINPQKQDSLINPILQNFANITAISSNNGEMRLCLGLK